MKQLYMILLKKNLTKIRRDIQPATHIDAIELISLSSPDPLDYDNFKVDEKNIEWGKSGIQVIGRTKGNKKILLDLN